MLDQRTNPAILAATSSLRPTPLCALAALAALAIASGSCSCSGEGEGEGEGEGAIDEDSDGYTTRIDCDDGRADVHPGATDTCDNGIDEDCSGADLSCAECPDIDGDGHSDAACGGDDCDDANGDVHPGLTEVCGDALDQDCADGDLACPACSEGAVPGTGCACGGITRTTGNCCAGAWQETTCGVVTILWTDDIQGTVSPWGFDGVVAAHPISTPVPMDDDANGASLTVVANPISGGGYAMRHFCTFDAGGSRAQAGVYSFVNTAFGAQAKSAEGIYVAQEWYFPEAVSAGGDEVPWINLWDWHSTDDGGGNRWHTAPGLMLYEDGSMRVRWEWGGPTPNSSSSISTVAMPVGEWFDIEMYYQWTASATTLRLWINGALALEQSGVQTRAASHQNVETYVKWYGSDQGGGPWAPTPSIRYTRNVRVAAMRITQ